MCGLFAATNKYPVSGQHLSYFGGRDSDVNLDLGLRCCCIMKNTSITFAML